VNERTEQLEEDDYPVLARLGYALARAQLFELALMKLLEAQRFDVDQPLEERWNEILGWLTKWTAGKAAKKLHLPEPIAADLLNIVRRRNVGRAQRLAVLPRLQGATRRAEGRRGVHGLAR
jgi:hypothetical protein